MDNLKNRQGLTELEFLAQYDPSRYDRPSATVDMLIFTILENKLKLLMVKRSDHPCIGQWALPGGFVNMNESLDEAAERELKEETNLENIYMEQLYTWGDVGRDPRTRIISTAYMALVDSTDLKVKAGDDADDADWFNVSCKLKHTQEEKTESVHQINSDYELLLTNINLKLSATVRVQKVFKTKCIKIKRSILEVDNIAVDHAKIIQQALEVLKNYDELKSLGKDF